jgi:endonuclease YncB( thermonuclease family)
MNKTHYFRRRSRAPNGLRWLGESLLALMILFIISATLLTFNGETVKASQGKARAIDGDSLELAGREIRLWGIDAPEFQQMCTVKAKQVACGREARKRLAELIRSEDLQCSGLGEDQYGRLLAVCRIGSRDINRQLVAEGHAFDFGGYPIEEAKAKRDKLGVWAGDTERPKQYRDRTKAGLDAEAGILDWLFHKLQAFTSS